MIVFVIAFYLPGDIPIYAFSLLVALGALAGLYWISQRAFIKRQAAIQTKAGLWAFLGGLIGGRAVYVVVNWPYFQRHWLEAPQVQRGGLAWPGALAGGMVVLALYAWRARQPLGKLSDALAPLLGLLAISAWLGCWFDGSAYGPIAQAWWGVPARDEWGLLRPRLPLQLLGAALTAGLFWYLEWYASRRKLRPGTQAGLAWLGLNLLLLVVSMLRADPAPLWGGWRLETWAALFYSALGLVVVLLLKIKDLRGGRSLVIFKHKAPLTWN
jgi:phosphatidylglycerol:prolipoprotein diacylglycerol transferase